MADRVTFRAFEPFARITKTSALPALPTPGVREKVIHFPSGE